MISDLYLLAGSAIGTAVLAVGILYVTGIRSLKRDEAQYRQALHQQQAQRRKDSSYPADRERPVGMTGLGGAGKVAMTNAIIELPDLPEPPPSAPSEPPVAQADFANFTGRIGEIQRLLKTATEQIHVLQDHPAANAELRSRILAQEEAASAAYVATMSLMDAALRHRHNARITSQQETSRGD